MKPDLAGPTGLLFGIRFAAKLLNTCRSILSVLIQILEVHIPVILRVGPATIYGVIARS